jgi:hypothetical protein
VPFVAEPAWRAYTGYYRSAWGDHEVLQGARGLEVVFPSQPDPRQGRGRLEPVDDHTFRLESDNGGQPVGELVRFELDEDGRVSRLWIGENWLERVPHW